LTGRKQYFIRLVNFSKAIPMTDYTIPCEVIARLSLLSNDAPDDAGPWFKSLRYDNGLLVASNGRLVAVENIGGPDGVFHLIVDAAMIAQCKIEAPFKSVMNVAVNDLLKFASAKTTLAWSPTANCVVWSDVRSVFDSWRIIVARHVAEPAVEPQGGMYWRGREIALLASTSPSGSVVFEETIDVNRPALMRDPYDENWFALFNPWNKDLETQPASLPVWMK
jgi:hypothetical protein